MIERRLDSFKDAVGSFIKEGLPAMVLGLEARLDVLTNTAWESLVTGTYAESRLTGRISPLRQRALRWMSAEDQDLAEQLKLAGIADRNASVPTMTDLVEVSRFYAGRTGKPCSVPASILG